MKPISFKFTFTSIGSWNGIWTGAGKNYYKVMYFALGNFMEDQKIKDFTYDFGDGWIAKVTAEIVDFETAEFRQEITHGFCGYEWMIDSIITNNKIQIKK